MGTEVLAFFAAAAQNIDAIFANGFVFEYCINTMHITTFTHNQNSWGIISCRITLRHVIVFGS
jgi:hypothetical protein